MVRRTTVLHSIHPSFGLENCFMPLPSSSYPRRHNETQPHRAARYRHHVSTKQFICILSACAHSNFLGCHLTSRKTKVHGRITQSGGLIYSRDISHSRLRIHKSPSLPIERRWRSELARRQTGCELWWRLWLSGPWSNQISKPTELAVPDNVSALKMGPCRDKLKS
jgi:hypothetical protein